MFVQLCILQHKLLHAVFNAFINNLTDKTYFRRIQITKSILAPIHETDL